MSNNERDIGRLEAQVDRNTSDISNISEAVPGIEQRVRANEGSIEILDHRASVTETDVNQMKSSYIDLEPLIRVFTWVRNKAIYLIVVLGAVLWASLTGSLPGWVIDLLKAIK